jgi:predicted metal-dependent HD superfamily phosphohydrolase
MTRRAMTNATPTTPEERAWLLLAEHFLDTETRHDLPRAALACVEAGYDVGAMEAALYGRVAPEVGPNLLSVAGEWAGWDDALLLPALRRRSSEASRWQKVLARRLPGVADTADSIARFMRLFEATPEHERPTTLAALTYLGQLYFDFAPGDPDEQAPRTLERLDAPFVDAFLEAIRPSTYRDDRARGRRALERFRAQLANRRAAGIDVRPLFASRSTWSAELGLPFELPERIASHLATAYDNGARAYHDLSHVVEVFERYRWVEMWRDPSSVALALLFHDAIYDAKTSTSEARSAELLGNMVRGTELEPLGERARALVRLTAEHGTTRPGDVDDDAAAFLDCDLAIVGAAPARYDAYETAIAVEYAHIPGPVYRHGRRRFLERLASRDRIFLTDRFHDAYDAAARANLRRAITALGG